MGRWRLLKVKDGVQRDSETLAAFEMLKRALSHFGGMDLSSPALRAWAFAVVDATPDGLRLTMAGDGSLRVFVSDGWVEGVALEIKRQTREGNRKRENNRE
jgi:hypothetical protein